MDYFYVPIYALVDLDPDGLSIMCTYKYGSKPLAHEGDWTRVPDLEWLGVRSIEAFATGNIENSGLMAASVHQNEGLLHLTLRDRRKATGMLSKQFVNEGGLNHELKRELQVMLMLNMKAEIEILESRDGGLASWLMERLNT
ncbi:Spo11/DNA topoisomerase VI subunit A [Neofusicoccum parvum]|uniref:Spo11/DNA topoisomerase VI subunit A n=1 Tax=Neofusicoccum parvum TaxID=310453 RepID=A0ACB5SBF1_9PEZI|nr:Spo11/DNA topoisomerase VI subunit A [Neofusicoccum parvum]GME60679.1 Spo11/DNA topoisomerase VI subunit A [Neofusicoccum parvum]